jgi:hypothetical protein
MSIERIERKAGAVVWRVRWRQAGQNRSKVLGRKRDAEAFDAELRRKRRTGELAALDAGKETLAEFGEEWWKLYAEPNLAASTLKVYAIPWDTHVLPRLGSLRLREITPSIVTRFRLELGAEGVGRVSIHKAMTLLQGVLQRACEWDRLASNPARAVRKPTAARARAVEPLTPDAVEAIRFWLLERELLRDATLVSVLAYAGLRPGEALALMWSAVRDRTLLVESAVSEGVAGETKTRDGAGRSACSLRCARTSASGAWPQVGRSTTRLSSLGTTAARGRPRRTRTGTGGSSGRRSPPRDSPAPARMTCGTRSSRS